MGRRSSISVKRAGAARHKAARPRQRIARKPIARKPIARKPIGCSTPRAVGPKSKLAQVAADLDEALQQQTALSEVLRLISTSPGDLERIFDLMLAHARRICDAEFGNIYRWHDGALHLIASHNTPPAFAEFRARAPFRPGPKSLIRGMLKTMTVAHIADAAANPDYIKRSDPSLVAAVELGGVRTYLAVPLLKDGNLSGVITVYRQEVRPFTAKQIALIKSFADHAVVAIENARLLNELRQLVQEQTASADVLKIISHSTFDLQTVLDTLVEVVVRLCDADLATMHREQGAAHRALAIHGGPLAHRQAAAAVPFEPGRGSVIGRAVQERKPVHVADVLADPEYQLHEAQQRIGFRTVLGVPLLREDQPIGIIVLMRLTVRPFTDRQIELVRNFAAQAVIAIENTRLLNQLRERTTMLDHSLGQVQASERTRDLLIDELNHRVGNLLSTTQGIVQQTLRSSNSKEDAVKAIADRITALGRAHRLLMVGNWKAAALGSVISAALEPFLETGGGIEISGRGDLWVSPNVALAITLAMNELATNAMKYGALSVAAGRVELVCEAAAEQTATITWTENGGPPVRPPTRKGFGSILLSRGLPAELGSEVSVDYRAEGVKCVMRFSVDAVPQPMQW